MNGIPKVESPFFDSSWFAEESDEIQEIAQSLHEDGYAVLDFPEPELEEMAESIVRQLAPSFKLEEWRKGEDLDLRIHHAWEFSPEVKTLATNAKILSLLEKLYGRQPIPFQTLNFPVGTQQHFHTDSTHFSSIPERFMCGVWVALEDTDEENGPLEYYPGSHRLPIYTNERIGCSHAPASAPYEHYDKYIEFWQKLVERENLQRHVFHAKKGQAIIWSANLLHGGISHLNRERTRHSQVTHYFFEDCAFYTPLTSDPFLGKINYLTIRSILTGEEQPQLINGEPVPDSLLARDVAPPAMG
ncbi:MAG: phytanoyl-CoA dioxygenase [Opitutae bacterium]|nr:phytanoyl-CoA dioxygenase [Opitutae bacterium]